MKLEQLARRLADKTNTPELEACLLEGKPLPHGCMIWTGAKLGSGRPKPRLKRDHSNVPVPLVVTERPHAVIRHEKRTHYVHRLIFQLMNKPDYQYRMENECGFELCVNPLHWKVITTGFRMEPVVSEDPPMTQQEVNTVVELMLEHESPTNWQDVISMPFMEGVPDDLLRVALRSKGQEHLT